MSRTTFQSFFAAPLALHQPLWPEIYRHSISADAPDAEAAAAREASTLYNDSPADDFVIGDGVAVVPIHGVITKRGYWWSSRLHTDRLTEIVKQLSARGDIETIVYDIDSGGGQVAGTAGLAQAMFEARSTTNQIAVVNEFAASAALWIATAANHIVIPPTAEIGSMGVYQIHTDWSKYLEELGVKDTVIHAGKYKAIHERELTPELKAHEQGLIDGIYSAFVDDVARFRGVDSDHALKTWGDAKVFLGSEAVSNGLADELGTLSDVLDSLASGRSGRISLPATAEPNEEDNDMLTLNPETGAIMNGDKQIGTLVELNISAEMLQQHCAAAVKSITDAAVAAAVETATAKSGEDVKVAFFAQLDELGTTFGEANLASLIPVVKGEKDAATFRAEQAEAKVAAVQTELETVKKNAATPGFSGNGNGGEEPEAGTDPHAAYKAAYAKDADGFACVEDFIAFKDAEAAGRV